MTIPDLIQTLGALYLRVIAEDFARYAIGAGGTYLVVNTALSTLLLSRQIRDRRPGWDQMRREIAASLRTVAIFAAFGCSIMVGAGAGLLPVYLDVAAHGWVWLGASTLLLIIAHDAWFYWAHRLMHYPPLFRRCHLTHHRSHNPTPFAAYAFDASEAAVQAAYLPLALMLIPSHPIAIIIFTTHMMLRNAIGHCGYEVFPARADGRPLLDWMTTVTHHDLHHAQAGWNLGLYFTFWDRVMGTEHPEYAARFAAAHGHRQAVAA